MRIADTEIPNWALMAGGAGILFVMLMKPKQDSTGPSEGFIAAEMEQRLQEYFKMMLQYFGMDRPELIPITPIDPRKGWIDPIFDYPSPPSESSGPPMIGPPPTIPPPPDDQNIIPPPWQDYPGADPGPPYPPMPPINPPPGDTKPPNGSRPAPGVGGLSGDELEASMIPYQGFQFSEFTWE